MPVEVVPEIAEEGEKIAGPPPATIARRAQSYSDFYHVVRDYLKKEHKVEKENRRRSWEEIKTTMKFEHWYGGMVSGLLDVSHEEYEYVCFDRNYQIPGIGSPQLM